MKQAESPETKGFLEGYLGLKDYVNQNSHIDFSDSHTCLIDKKHLLCSNMMSLSASLSSVKPSIFCIFYYRDEFIRFNTVIKSTSIVGLELSSVPKWQTDQYFKYRLVANSTLGRPCLPMSVSCSIFRLYLFIISFAP